MNFSSRTCLFGVVMWCSMQSVTAEPVLDFAPFEYDSEAPGILHLSGQIDARTPILFKRALSRFPEIDTLTLNSQGGSVFTAVSMGYDIREARIKTVIRNGDVCFSACAFLFFGGADRSAEGPLGVHQLSSASNDLRAGQMALGDISRALKDFGVATEILSMMVETPATDMRIIPPEELAALGLIDGGGVRPILVPKEDPEDDLPFVSSGPKPATEPRSAAEAVEPVRPPEPSEEEWVQKMLRAVGYNEVSETTFDDGTTLLRLGRFQWAAGLKVTNDLNRETRRRLEQSVKRAERLGPQSIYEDFPESSPCRGAIVDIFADKIMNDFVHDPARNLGWVWIGVFENNNFDGWGFHGHVAAEEIADALNFPGAVRAGAFQLSHYYDADLVQFLGVPFRFGFEMETRCYPDKAYTGLGKVRGGDELLIVNLAVMRRQDLGQPGADLWVLVAPQQR